MSTAKEEDKDVKNEQTTIKRPPRTTLEGMIWNANEVLERALDPKVNGIPRNLFEISIGLVLISVVEIGVILSGNVGTGILLKKQPREKDGRTGVYSKWSAPCACGLSVLGWGFLVGASVKEVMVFIMDEPTLASICTSHGFKLGVQAETTLGPLGRSYDVDADFSKKGVGSTINMAFSKGAFIGLSMSGAVVGVRDKVNATFYNTPGISVNDILDVPRDELLKKIDGRVHLLDDVYDKLLKVEDEFIERAVSELALEKQRKIDADGRNEKRKADAAVAAEKAHHDLMKENPTDHDVIEVNAHELASKE